MNTFIVFSCLIAVSLAAPETAEVYLTQDSHGNYRLSVKSASISRSEERTQNGNVVGNYAFVDPTGNHHRIDYAAGAETGFSATGADVPTPVAETAELIEARSKHLAVLAAEQAKFPFGVPEEKPVPLSAVLAQLVLPEIPTLPVEAVPAESADNYKAKAELLAEYARVLTNLAEEYRKVLN